MKLQYLYALLSLSSLALAESPGTAPKTQAEKTAPSSTDWKTRDAITWPKAAVGVSVGSHTGLSLYHSYGETRFVTGFFGVNGRGSFSAGVDFGHKNLDLVPQIPRLEPYLAYGIGYYHSNHEMTASWYSPVVRSDDKQETAQAFVARLSLGALFPLPTEPIQLGLELGPQLRVYPSLSMHPHASVLARYIL